MCHTQVLNTIILYDTCVLNLGSFKELYYQAINDLGSEEIHICKVVLFGPPGVGKSSLCGVLLQLPQSNHSSTGIFDLKLVQFTIEVTKDNKGQKSFWNVVTLEKEIERLRHTIEAKLDKQNEQKYNAETQRITPKVLPQNIKYLPEENQRSFGLTQRQPSLEDVTLPHLSNDQIIHEVVCKHWSNSAQEQKSYDSTSKILIALYDSGGQPEFFDVMPLLNTAPTGNVMVYNMNEPLDAEIIPALYDKGHLECTGSKAQYTNAQLMKTALANIESCVTKDTSSSGNKILVVGTHLDKYEKGKENIEKSLSYMDDELNKKVLSKSARDMVVYYKREGKEDRIVHPISNTECTENQVKVAQKIRTAIEEMSTDTNTRTKIPNSWLLFQYQIRLLKKPCITLSKCQNIAKHICYMEEDVKVALKYFHDLGILLNYEELDDVVFCNPQWVFDQVSKLIRAKYNASFSADVENGIVKKDFMAKNIYSSLEKDTDNILKLKELLGLFVSLNIMAKLPEKSSEKCSEERYFMPALLNPASQTLSLSEFGKTFYDTMYVLYKGTLFPRGMFCCLVTLLAQDQRNFKLLETKQCMYKNLIVFQIIGEENESYLILSDKINYMTIEIYQKEQYNLLQKVYYELLEALQKVCKKLKVNYQFEFGFICSEKICKKKSIQDNIDIIAVVELNYNFCPKVMCCRYCGKSVALSYNQLLWFVPVKVVNTFETEVSK